MSTAWWEFLAGSACCHSCAGRNPSPGNPLDSCIRGNDGLGASSRIADEGLPLLYSRQLACCLNDLPNRIHDKFRLIKLHEVTAFVGKYLGAVRR